ncbi:DNA-binding protein [Sulfodiicoccus acidiphilus]|uniref:DNA-binding protein n=1 Tax=Sulfodiicoccus acidiphilus TaxID=1670455 RepID=A0A348B1M2_9CREN|nr:Zn-ribbon domain-containing OB-fold protein [Sulfodiicoccus acidiphilus]BBD72074.1 DNA-binding protein [Sulfodiicoccus acidiphilus]GGU05579.1 DNA-binding protein [Sulfodiicoccus acidiphilus]
MNSTKGTPLSEEDFKRAVKEITRPRAVYDVAPGEAYSRFFRGLKEGKILGTRCPSCRLVHVPPKVYCQYCYVPLTEWVEVKDEGYVETAVVVYIAAERERLETPEVVGVVRLEGSGDEYRFPGLMHRICADPDDVKSMKLLGSKVRARWAKEKQGGINDIECFEVVQWK